MKRYLTKFPFFYGSDDGGSGGAPVIEVPAAPVDNSPENQEIVDFQVPPISMEDGGVPVKSDPAPPAAPTAKPNAEPKKTEPVKQSAPPPKKGTEPPVNKLREEYELAKKERDELKETLAKGDPKLKAAEEAVKAAQAELADLKKKETEFERKLALNDPSVTAEIRKLDADYDTAASKFFARTPEIDQKALQGLMADWFSLKPGTQDYKERREEFEAKVNESLGGSEERIHHKLGAALDFIEKTGEFSQERQRIAKEVSSNALKLQREAQKGEYSKQRDFVRSAIEKAKTIPEGMDKTNPMHPKVLLNTFLGTLSPEQRSQMEGNVDEFVEFAMAGPALRTEEDYNGMTPQQIAESKGEESARHEKARHYLADVARNGLVALRVVPSLWREIERLRAKVKETTDSAPPDPTSGGDPGDASRDDGSVESYSPRPLSDLRV